MSGAWLWLALSVAGSSGGNLLMKVANRRGAQGMGLFFSKPFVLGGVFFGLGLLAYMQALATIPLAIAYPAVVGTSIFAITTVAVWRLEEKIVVWHVLGVALIFAGLFIIAQHTPAPDAGVV